MIQIYYDINNSELDQTATLKTLILPMSSYNVYEHNVLSNLNLKNGCKQQSCLICKWQAWSRTRKILIGIRFYKRRLYSTLIAYKSSTCCRLMTTVPSHTKKYKKAIKWCRHLSFSRNLWQDKTTKGTFSAQEFTKRTRV